MSWHRLLLTLTLALGLILGAPFSGTPDVRAAADCSEFIADVTIPDGQYVSPGQTFEKIWRLRNCGDAAWDGYRAIRTGGTFGPESFSVPFTPPGATADLAVTMTAPDGIGEHWAAYRIETPTRRLGAGTVLVDVADCSLPEAPALAMAGADVQSARLQPSVLGSGWCAVRGDSETRWIIERYANAESDTPVRALFWTSVWPDEAAAAQAFLGLPKGWVISEAAQSIEGIGTEPEIGDSGRRLAWTLTGSTMHGVSYAYRVGRGVGWIEVSGHADDDASLDLFALRLVDEHVTRLRDIPPSHVERPSPDLVLNTLLATPFTRSLLSEGLSPSRVREVDSAIPDGSQPTTPGADAAPAPLVGMAELLVTNRRDTASRPGEIVYVVYRTDEDALASFLSLRTMAYVHTPSSIGHTSMCSVGECAVLDGTVLILTSGAPGEIDTPGWGILDPKGFSTITLARSAAAHLDQLLDRLMQE